jgi:PAS domain S-box-containing protein
MTEQADMSMGQEGTEAPPDAVARLRLALQAAHVGTWEVDLETQQVEGSEVSAMLFGFEADADQLRVADVLARIHPDDRRRVQVAVRAATLQGAPLAVEYRVLWPDGTLRWISSRGELVRASDGRPVQLVGAHVDITERKWSDARLRLLAETGTLLRHALDAETTLRGIVELLVPPFADDAVVYALTPAGGVRALAWSCADPDRMALLGLLLEEPSPPDPGSPVYAVLEHGAPRLLRGEAARTLLTLPFGGHVEVSGMITPPRAGLVVPLMARGRTIGALSCAIVQPGRAYDEADLELAQEVAWRAAMAIDNARLYQEAQQAIRVRDNFITVASHDLRSPLTVLLGQTQLLERRAELENLSERVVRTVRSIAQQGERLNRLIASLLDLSRIQTGRLTLDLATLDLGALLQRIVAELQPSLSSHVLTLLTEPATCVVRGDELRLEQVFQNLIGNAVKYTPASGTIVIRLERSAAAVQVAVEDQGIGIPPEAMPHLFEQFYRAPNAKAGAATGLGIGLYVVREIVGLHGGVVEVSSEEGRGSTFTVTLPLPEDE